MKVDKFIPVVQPEYRLELTRKEAEILCKLMGLIGGTGHARLVADLIYDELHRLGVESDTISDYSGLISVNH